MFKKSIFTLLFVAAMGWVSAQSLQFELNGTVYQDGDAVECTNDEFGYGEYIQHMQIRNLTSSDIDVMVEREIMEDLEGVSNFFCWGMCFNPEVSISPRPVTVEANSLTEEAALSFHSLFDEDVFGYQVVKYSAFDATNPTDRVSIIVKFHKSGTGVNEQASFQFGQAYPNPASSTVSFDCHVNGQASAVVYNLLGQEVLRQELNSLQNKLSISVADLQDGIYFCNLTQNGQTLGTTKFVVKK